MPISDLSKLPDYSKLIASGIDKIQAFKPLAELQVLNNIAKLDSNESFLGPSPAAIEVLLAKAGSESHLYPETSGQQLKTALAARTNTHPDCITLGNGSNDVLDIVARTFCRPGDEIIFSQYAFAAYSILTAIVGAEAVQTPATTGYGHDLKAMAGAITPKTKLIFIANPNNPTGTWSDCDALETLLDSVPSEVLVVLDEAYIEYCTDTTFPNGLNYLSRYPNLIVVRTFSKAWGLAALRVGYAVCDPAIADYLNRVRQPFNVNRLALAAATAALADSSHLERTVRLTHTGMRLMTDRLEEKNISYIPSKGNFICIKVGDALHAAIALRQQGILVTPLTNYGLEQYLRVTIGKKEDNERFLNQVFEYLAMKAA